MRIKVGGNKEGAESRGGGSSEDEDVMKDRKPSLRPTGLFGHIRYYRSIWGGEKPSVSGLPGSKRKRNTFARGTRSPFTRVTEKEVSKEKAVEESRTISHRSKSGINCETQREEKREKTWEIHERFTLQVRERPAKHNTAS